MAPKRKEKETQPGLGRQSSLLTALNRSKSSGSLQAPEEPQIEQHEKTAASEDQGPAKKPRLQAAKRQNSNADHGIDAKDAQESNAKGKKSRKKRSQETHAEAPQPEAADAPAAEAAMQEAPAGHGKAVGEERGDAQEQQVAAAAQGDGGAVDEERVEAKWREAAACTAVEDKRVEAQGRQAAACDGNAVDEEKVEAQGQQATAEACNAVSEERVDAQEQQAAKDAQEQQAAAAAQSEDDGVVDEERVDAPEQQAATCDGDACNGKEDSAETQLRKACGGRVAKCEEAQEEKADGDADGTRKAKPDTGGGNDDAASTMNTGNTSPATAKKTPAPASSADLERSPTPTLQMGGEAWVMRAPPGAGESDQVLCTEGGFKGGPGILVDLGSGSESDGDSQDELAEGGNAHCSEEVDVVLEFENGSGPDNDVQQDTDETPWYEKQEFLLPGEEGHLDMENFVRNLSNFWVRRLARRGRLASFDWSAFPDTYFTGSYCTGSAMGELCIEAAVQSLTTEHGIMSRIVVVVMAEKELWKTRWLVENGWTRDHRTCLFQDATLVAGNTGSERSEKENGNECNEKLTTLCVNHGRPCRINRAPRPHHFKSGFSCKAVSSCHVLSRLHRDAMNKGMDVCTVRTFAATTAFIEERCPDTWVLENVDNLGSEEDCASNLSLILATLRSLRDSMYAVSYKTLDSREFGLPQSRHRIYFVGVRVKSLPAELDDGDDVFSVCSETFPRDFEAIMEELKIPMAPVEKVILPAGSQYLEAELQRREGRQKDELAEADAAAPQVVHKWTTLHSTSCFAKGWSWPMSPPPELQGNRWFKTAPPRECELVIKAETEGCFASDVSQSWGRTRDVRNGNRYFQAVMPGCHIWFGEEKGREEEKKRGGRFLIGRDLLALQGFPVESMPAAPGFSEAQLADLAGNAFSSCCSLAVDLAVLACTKWTRRRSAVSEAHGMVMMIGDTDDEDEW
eukprot:TRINITY_DN10755_c0_g1_i1.p1 TRINITY_DN10755_c0_g1~~TRINITY_DN10755_c0_g1_i1.p1  ORF type:complete len:1004 (-),score=265.38 TRINITY_DN10755_c0_g1_i1:181-3081(-)